MASATRFGSGAIISCVVMLMEAPRHSSEHSNTTNTESGLAIIPKTQLPVEEFDDIDSETTKFDRRIEGQIQRNVDEIMRQQTSTQTPLGFEMPLPIHNMIQMPGVSAASALSRNSTALMDAAELSQPLLDILQNLTSIGPPSMMMPMLSTRQTTNVATLPMHPRPFFDPITKELHKQNGGGNIFEIGTKDLPAPLNGLAAGLLSGVMPVSAYGMMGPGTGMMGIANTAMPLPFLPSFTPYSPGPGPISLPAKITDINDKPVTFAGFNVQLV